jgi:hypothetical protein
MVPRSFVAELRQIVGKSNVLDSEVDLQLYKYDAYLEERRPDAVVFVHSTDEVAGVVKVCNKFGVPFVPRGGGTKGSGGTIPFKGGVVIDPNEPDPGGGLRQSAGSGTAWHVQFGVRERAGPLNIRGRCSG